MKTCKNLDKALNTLLNSNCHTTLKQSCKTYRIIFNSGKSIKVFANNMTEAKAEAKRICRTGHNPLHTFIKSIYRYTIPVKRVSNGIDTVGIFDRRE